MPGGLVQLLTIGMQDAPLILNPEITFFKTVYRRYTNFAIEQIIKSIGHRKFSSFYQYKIPEVNDLLSGFHFIIDIPYFDVLKTVTTKTSNTSNYNINELSVIYSSTKTYLLFEATSKTYYLVPENFFTLSTNDDHYSQVSGITLEENLLAGLNLLGTNNYGIQVDIFQLKNSSLNQLLTVLRLNFNNWFEFWLKIFENNQQFIYFTNIVSQLNLVSNLNAKLNLILYDGYINYNIFNQFRNYLNFKDEIENYFNYDPNNTQLIYDVDYAISYAKSLNLDLDTYKNNALKLNSLFYLFLLQSIYADFSKQIKGYTFWKKYQLSIDNLVDTNIVVADTNYFLEWKSKINLYQSISFDNLEISNKYKKNYFNTEQTINNIFNTLDVTDTERTWCILKVFYNQFTDNTTNTICFDDHFNPNSTTLNLNYNISTYFQNVYTTLNTDSNLNSSWSNFDDPTYIQPVDLALIYPYLAYKLTDAVVNQQLFNDYHFFVLWRNKITIAYFFRLGENLDNYHSEKTSTNTFQNTFLNLNDYDQKNKNLAFYHNINVNRNLKLDNIRDEMNKMFYCESFYGSININAKTLESNYVFPAPSYRDVGVINYDLVNQEISITDQDSFSYSYTNNTLSIPNWNRRFYQRILIETLNGFLEVFDFNIIDNVLYIYLSDSINLSTESKITIKMIKNILVPVLDFVPIIDGSGNIDYPNIKVNTNDFPDISFNQIQNNDLPINTYNLYNVNNSIVVINNIINDNGTLRILGITGIYNKFYELKITNFDFTISRIAIRLDNDVITSEINLNFSNIISIDLLEIDFNLELIDKNVIIVDNIIYSEPTTITPTNYFWLVATMDNNNNILPKTTFLPVVYNGTNFIAYGNYLNYTWDLYQISNSLVPNLYPILYHHLNTDPSGNIYNYQLNASFYQDPFILNTYDNSEPYYYFYNIPSNENTISITINGFTVNKLFSINPSEFYTKNDVRYPVVFDIINLKSYTDKNTLIDSFNSLFDANFLNNANYSYLVKALENANSTYENLYFDTISTLQNLGQTINTVVNNTVPINSFNLLEYNTFDFKSHSLITPDYYDLSSNFINTGIGMSKLLISDKGIILTQMKQKYQSSTKINSNLIDYLNTVSTTLVDNIAYINNNNDLINVLDQNQYAESYQPQYILENIVENNFYDISSYKLTTLFDISGDLLNTEIYFNDNLIDLSNNNVATGDSLVSITEKNSIVTEIVENNINYLNSNVFNYLGPVYFVNHNIPFLTTYIFKNYYNSVFLLLDDNSLVKLIESTESNFKIYYNGFECTFEASNSINKGDTYYVYKITLSTNNVITGNTVIINFNLYSIELYQGYYILIGKNELIITNKYLICGNSTGTIGSFVPTNFILINNYNIYKNFKTNIYVNGSTSEKIYNYVNSTQFNYLDYINTSTHTYYDLFSTESQILTYNIINKYLIPPFTLGNKTVNLINNNQDYFIDNFNENYYYKFDDDIIQGKNFKNLDVSGNFNLWVYPNSKLKLIDLGALASVTYDGYLQIYSWQKLIKNSYYYIAGDIHFVGQPTENYRLTSLMINTKGLNTLYLIDDSNFRPRDQQYISIIDNTSSEAILPNIDLTPNNTFEGYAKVDSYYYYDSNQYKNILPNELDILLSFKDSNNNAFIKPFNFTYDISNNSLPCYIYFKGTNYYDFLVYKESDLQDNFVFGNIVIPNQNMSDTYVISCSDPKVQIDNNNSFLLSLYDSIGLQKFKLVITINGVDIYYSTIWTLKMDDSAINYNLTNVIDIGGITPLTNLINVDNNNQIISPQIFTITSGYNVLGETIINIDASNNLIFENISSNSTRQQIYYNSNILSKNKLIKLEYNYDPSYDYIPELVQCGTITIFNQNYINIPVTSDLKYLVLNNNGTKYIRYITNIDISNNIAYFNEGLNAGTYNVLSSTRYLFLIENPFYIYTKNGNYYITNYKKNILKQGDIITFGDNIFEVLGLNSFTMYYDLNIIKVVNVQSFYPGFFLLYRLNATPKIEKTQIVDFKLNSTPVFKLAIDYLNNIVLSNSAKLFSIDSGDNIMLYYMENKFYNIFNYLININDYLVFNSNVYRVNLIKENTLILNDFSNFTEGFYTFYLPYQPCKAQNISFDSSGNLIYSSADLFFYEISGNFISSTQNITMANTTIYTRTIEFQQKYYYFQNKIPRALKGTITGTILNITDNISTYDFYYNQPIQINSFICYIKKIDSYNRIYIDRTIFQSSTTVNVYFGIINEKLLYSNYALEKSCYLKPVTNLGYYHYYDVSNNTIVNYDISQNLVTSNNIVFEDNILNLDTSNNMINLHNSYHILLEKNQYNQYISHLCQLRIPNQLFIFTNVEDYNSTFYLDKIHPILLNSDNTFSYLNSKLIIQNDLASLPFNKLIIWRKYDLIITGLVQNVSNGFRVSIDATQIISLIGFVDFFIDKTIACTIVNDNSVYYLITAQIIENYNYLYTKETNYVTSSTKQDYTETIVVNDDFAKPFGVEHIKLPNTLTLITQVDYYYYSLSKNFSIFNNINYSYTTGFLNLQVYNNYYDNVKNQRVIETKDKTSKLDSIFINDIPTNIFDENYIYLDSDGLLRNIFNQTLFKVSSLFNSLKTWNSWSLVSNPDINKNVMSKGDFACDRSGNVTRTSSNTYYTNDEVIYITNFLNVFVTVNIDNFNSLQTFETSFYNNLQYYVKVEAFWRDPVTFINNLISDLGLPFFFDGTNLLLNNNRIDNIILNNQYNLTFDGTYYIITRDVTFIKKEIYNLVNNSYDDNLYGVKVNDVLQFIVTLSNYYTSFESTVFSFSGKCVNYADLILYILKQDLFQTIPDYQKQLYKLQQSLSADNDSLLGLDILKNTITYNTDFTNCTYLGTYPYLPTVQMYNINVPILINYNIDISSGLYPYKIMLTDETYVDQSIYKLNFLEGEYLLDTLSVDYLTVYNNQIEFFTKEDLNVGQNFSINSYKSYDVSSYKFIGYVFQLTLLTDDLKNLNFSSFTAIKYRNMNLVTYNNYLVFPNYIDQLTSFIQTEIIVGVESSYSSNGNTFITLLNLNQVLNALSTDYTLFFQTNNQNYKVDDVYNKDIRVEGTISNFVNTKLILTIKPIAFSNLQLLMFHLVLASKLINYSYYFDLVNVVKNFQVNDSIYCKNLNFIGENELDVLLSSTDVSSNYVINNIVHYAKIGEYPPEPIKTFQKLDTFLYQFADKPYINTPTSCFLVYDLNYNEYNADEYINNFINNFATATYYRSIDIIDQPTLTQFVCNKYISNKDLHEHTFGGVINEFYIGQFTHINNLLRFIPADNFDYNSRYYYFIDGILIDNITYFSTSDVWLKGGYVEILYYNYLDKPFIFTQMIIEKHIIQPAINQLAEIELFDPIDIEFDGYIQTLDNNGNEIGDYIYLLNVNAPTIIEKDSTIYFNSSTITEGKVLLESPLYVISPVVLGKVNSVYIKELDLLLSNITVKLVQYSYMPFTLYKKIALGKYQLFFREGTLYFLDYFYSQNLEINKFYLVSKFAKLTLEKRFNNQVMSPSPSLTNVTTTSTIVTTTTEKAIFNKNLYNLIFNYIEFYINDQLIEQLNPDVMNIQYQFLKDPQRRAQFDKYVKPYRHKDSIRIMIPLEFWFDGQSPLYLPIISLQHSMLSLKFEINNIANLISNGPNNSDTTTTYKIINHPEINIDLNIDGILLDTPERELFGNNQHEYLIEIFKTYPVSLISTTTAGSNMKFKNLVKDIFFNTQVLSSGLNTYIKTTETYDPYYKDYKFKKSLYIIFEKTGTFTNIIKVDYILDFNYLKQADYDIVNKAPRYLNFMQSAILSKQNMEFVLYMDGKYQASIIDLSAKRQNLELYFSFIYENVTHKTEISPITTLNIQTAGIDLFKPMDSTYFNLVVPYQKYLNSVDLGYYGYCFALYPNEKQPSGHVNFSTLDDIVIKTTNNSQVVNDPFILKTSVREYQILRIMSGMGALSWID